MDAEIPVVAERRSDGSGNPASTDLQRRAVGNVGRDVRRDTEVGIRRRRLRDLGEGRGMLDDRVHFIDVEQGITEHARHVGVHLDDQAATGARRDARVVVHDAEREVTARVHRADLHQERVDVEVFADHARQVREVDRNEVEGFAVGPGRVGDNVVIAPGDEERMGTELLDDPRLQDRVTDRIAAHAVVEVEVEQIVGTHTIGESCQNRWRRPEPHRHQHLHTRGDGCRGIRCRHELATVLILNRHP